MMQRNSFTATSPPLPTSATKLLTTERERFREKSKVGPWVTGIKAVDSQLPQGFWNSGCLIGVSETKVGAEGGEVCFSIHMSGVM